METTTFSFGKRAEDVTPVRRRLSTINTRQPQGDSEMEWTAARCSRLLRALQSRIAILNKDLSRVQSGSQGREAIAEVRAGRIRKADADSDWNQARKKVKRTYSTRRGRNNNEAGGDVRIRKLQSSNEARAFIPGEVSVPTPILNRARGETISAKSSTEPPLEINGQELRPNRRTKDVQSNSQLFQTLRDIRKQTPASRYAIYEGIYNGLEALLKATNPAEPQQNRTGPKSLFSLCLRAVPQYITQEEELSAAYMEETKSKSAINNTDISIEIYNDLEAFGSNGKGWKHFRTIVRSHGVQLLSDAIRTGSLDADFIGILITLCIHTKATKEAEILLSSLLSTGNFPLPKSVFNRFDDEPATRPLSMLWKFVEITGSFSYQYRQLSTLISDGLLPLDWLATKEFGPVWTRAIQVLPTDSNDIDALLFMDTVLPLLAQTGGGAWTEDHSTKRDGLMLNAVKQTFSSLLTTLSSIVILKGDTAKQTQVQNTSLHTTEYDHFITLTRSCLIQWELSHVFNIQGTLLVITNLILKEVGHESSGSESDLIDILFNHLRHMSKSSTILPSYHEVVAFICSIARCCGRGASNSGFEYLEDLHHKMESLICNRDSEGVNIFRGVLADSAVAFAQEIPDRRHLDYADEMESKFHRMETKPKASLTPGHSLDRSMVGFRWEEGISEWVTATPFLSTSKCQDLRKFPREQRLECESPFRPTIQQKLKKSVPLNFRAGVLRFSESLGTTAFSPRMERSPVSESSLLGHNEGHVANGTSAENGAVDQDDSEDDLVSINPFAFESPSTLDPSGDELASESTEQDPLDDEGSRDELQTSSPQTVLSNNSEQASSPHSECFLMDESFTSASSADASRSKEPGSGRRRIDRVPRLSRRVLRRSLEWQLFDDDESDDELSFISASSEGGSILQEITNNVGPSTRRQQQTKSFRKQTSFGGFGDSLLGDSDSEDELCI
jgi:hypothetical protein